MPECARAFVAARDFYISYHEIDNSEEVCRNSSHKLIRRMWNGAPNWLTDLSKLVILEYSRAEQSQNRYTRHFKSINFELDLPEGEFFCLSIVNNADIEDLEVKRRVQIADWIHSQAALWSKYVADKNKNIRKKEEWVLPLYPRLVFASGLEIVFVNYRCRRLLSRLWI